MSAPLPSGYATTPSSATRWRPFYELAHRITPPEVAAYQPVTPEHFRAGASMRIVVGLINSLSGVHGRGLITRTEGGRQVVATTRLEAHARGRAMNGCQMMLDPEHGQLAPHLVNATLRIFAQLSPHNRIQCHVPNWQPALIEAALASGFTRPYESHAMGMNLSA